MRVCWDHQITVDASQKFCTECGMKMEAMPKCECGREQGSRHEIYCGDCGRQHLQYLVTQERHSSHDGRCG